MNRPASGDDRIKVTLLVRYFTVGGLERVVISLANGLAARGADVRVVVLGISKRNALITELSPRVEVNVLTGTLRRRMSELRRLTAGRTVHLHFGDGAIHPLVRAALWGRRVIVSYHSVYSHKRSRTQNLLDRFVNIRTDAIIAVSTAVRDFCVHEVGLRSTKVTVVPNAVHLNGSKRVSTREAEGSLSIISLAGLYPHKSQVTVIRAVAEARRRGADLTLRVVGDGPELASLYQLTASLGLHDSVEWYGQIWRRDMVRPLLDGSDAFVSASHFEGMPISILEAMSSGLPLVLTDIPSHRETAADAGTYFPVDSAEQLANELIKLLDSPERRRDREEASSRRFDDFDIDAFVGRHLDIYRPLADA